MLKKNIYRWHRTCSLIIAIPVLLSAGSGFMHPIMTNLRPSVATQGIRPVPIDSSQLILPLVAALDSNHIDSISRFRIVHIDTTWFYQVQRWRTDEPVYLSTRTGSRLPNGDWLYAQWLARQFLEGPSLTPEAHHSEKGIIAGASSTDRGTGSSSTSHEAVQKSMSMAMDMSFPMADCCNAATSSVLNAKGSRVVGAARLTTFDEEYNEINRLLPVYRVSFDRPDGMRIYVETTQDRFSLAVDHRRATFNKVFQYIHTYQWLDFLGEGKQIVLFLLMAIAFLTTIMGIYIFFSTRSKRQPGNGYIKARRNHRYTAIVISLFTLMFTFSGGYHALYKLKKDTRDDYFVQNRFAARSIRFDYGSLAATVRHSITGIGLIRMGTDRYWQITTGNQRGYINSGTTTGADSPSVDIGVRKDWRKDKKDLMKDKQVAAPEVLYINTADGSILPGGESRYAAWLATQFSGHPPTGIVSVKQITKFDEDYNFTDKRLPVWKVSYPDHGHERYYVETSSGSLSVKLNDWDLIEAYSFALLHKHEFLGGIGKWAKDTSTMLWAAAQLFMVILGLILYFKRTKFLKR